MKPHPFLYRRRIEEFLAEDIGHGDVTTLSLKFPQKRCCSVFVAKEDLIIAGIPFALEVFRILDEDASFEVHVAEGDEVVRGRDILSVEASVDALLMGERTALNMLQRLSGIATLTREMVERIKGTGAILVDTRKTTPGFRFFEKYAVRVGGATNHRMGLYDCVMVKDNHIKAVGSIREAIRQVRGSSSFTLKVEVEVKSLEELEEAVEAGADVVLLDNMDIATMREAVRKAKGRVLLEASGGITPENVRAVAETGVDYISTGFIVHHAVWKDISMKIL